MAITFIEDGIQAGSPTGCTLGPIDLAGANFIIIAHSYLDAATISTGPTDSVNTYTPLPARTSPASNTIRLHYCENANTSAPLTFTTTGTNMLDALAVLAFSSVKASGAFDANNDGATAGPTTTLLAGNVSPSEDNELIVCGISFGTDAISGLSIDLGFATPSLVNLSSGNNYGLGISYLIQGAAATVNPAFSWTTSVEAAMSSATFRAETARRLILSSPLG